MRSTPPLSLRSLPNVTFETSNVRLIDDGPLSPFQIRSSSSFHASLLQAIDRVRRSKDPFWDTDEGCGSNSLVINTDAVTDSH